MCEQHINVKKYIYGVFTIYLNFFYSIFRLQTSRALYQAARQSHAVLEKIWLPKFLHSEEVIIILIYCINLEQLLSKYAINI